MTEPVIIKKYANRRLYNTDSSTYATLDTLAVMVRDGIEFMVCDAKSGEDLTRGVLTQIIVEQEAKGTNLLPIGFLRQIISLYGGAMQGVVPGYLDAMMQHFAAQQQQLQAAMKDQFGKIFPNFMPPGSPLDAMARQNMAQMEKYFEQMTQFFLPPFQQNAKDREETLNALKQKMAEMDRAGA